MPPSAGSSGSGSSEGSPERSAPPTPGPSAPPAPGGPAAPAPPDVDLSELDANDGVFSLADFVRAEVDAHAEDGHRGAQLVQRLHQAMQLLEQLEQNPHASAHLAQLRAALTPWLEPDQALELGLGERYRALSASELDDAAAPYQPRFRSLGCAEDAPLTALAALRI